MAAQKPVVIERHPARLPAFDYEQLRKEAIAQVQELSGKIWTDYNLHDPGVTILEQLCFAITDLAYRTAFPIDEILADKHGNIDPLQHAFFAKAAILSTCPVTVNDYRKLLLDEIEEVENVWIEPIQSLEQYGSTKGVYRVFLQIVDTMVDAVLADKDTLLPIVEKVERTLKLNRNLGEDIEEILVLKPEEIFIKAELVVDSRYDAQELMARICNAFEFVMHPPVRFFTEAELKSKGYAVEDIYSGPLLKKGFIIDEDLRPRVDMVDPAELVKSVSQVAGVIKVKSLYIAGADGEFTGRPMTLEKMRYPLFQVRSTQNDIKIISDKYEYRLKDIAFWNAYQKMKIIGRRQFVGQQAGDEHPPLKAAYRNISWYHSLQRHFPAIYGIGEHGVDAESSEKRKAQARQLKGYLLFFEQLLANYLAQLGSIGNFFAPVTDPEKAFTYAVQGLYDVPNVQHLIKAFTAGMGQGPLDWDTFTADTGNAYMRSLREELETDKIFQERKHQVLDHLLARFNLVLMKYPVTLYEHVYNAKGAPQRLSRELLWKADVLLHAEQLTAHRLRTYNYNDDIFGSGELSGYEKWLYKLLYIPDEKRKWLSAVFDTDEMKVTTNTWADQVYQWQVKDYEVKDEVLKVAVQDLPETPTELPPVKYEFGSQPVSFLRRGLDTANYRIVFDEQHRHHLVIYQQNPNEVWREVIRTNTREAADHALKDMISYLKKLSTDAEGFYLVEHQLLKPRFTERRFGYRLYDRNGQVLREHPYWYTFEEREEQLASLQDEAAEKQGYFEYYVKHDYGKLLREDFYRFGLSIVLPSWPARFQLEEFRTFAVSLIREHTPVQFHIQFKWLGISAMRRFEEHYRQWLQELQNRQDAQFPAGELVSLLAADHYFDR
ncbi:hypothetical protein F0L74_27855 [Chitinophaga agrisoli]|uniref:Uncharacterized protein n=1 Tax=Chitinophaga agrisoli TaxID=2607653 RepID=A0A5B2VP73_9BACT|nr:hypothetical protein [Chitinophaga agrisoli]KAA2239997.1 hypothetical protein F0L74_27855 [Chitinophaga agrisoli]